MGKIKLFIILIITVLLTIPAYADTADNRIDTGQTDVDYYGQYQNLISRDETRVRVFDLSYGEAEKIPVLLYHHLLKEEEYYYEDNPAAITLEAFEEQMAYLDKYGFNTITLVELEKFLKGQMDVPKRSVVITFDDGYSSNYHYAYPILKGYGFDASIFLITHSIKDMSETFTPERSTPLGWDQIVNSMDVFEYANHSHNLHREDENGSNYLAIKPYDVIKGDLQTNKTITQSHYFAYPYGKYNDMTLEILEELDYHMAFTTRTNYVRRGDPLLELSRFGIYPSTSMMRFREIIHGIG